MPVLLPFELNSMFFGTAALIGGLVLFWKGFRELRLRRLILNTPTAHIRSMAMGLVELQGAVEARSSTVAPFSGRPCAYWEVDIATQGGRRNTWKVVHRNASGHPFYLRDESGLALVYPHGADCRIHFGVSEVCSGLGLPPPYAEYLSNQGIGMGHLWRLGTLRFRERVLEQDQRVYVLGTAMPRSRAITIGEGEAMAATGTDGRAVHLLTADEEVVATVRQGENDPTFLISQDSERALILTTGIKATACLYGGPVLALVGLVYWLDRLSRGALFR